MKKLAIISEFNPFHNGHEYILNKAKEETGADIAISLMSGDFVQRGEPAIIDKFARADSAMKSGFDMVVEMPVHISLQSAEYFASGSVKILDKLNVDYLCFGIEKIEPGEFLEKVEILINRADELDNLTKEYMKEASFTKARYDATCEILGENDFITSNNILALEYIRAIHKINSSMKPIPIKRISSANKDGNLRDTNISSSTAIRAHIDKDYKTHVPAYSYENINAFIDKYGKVSMNYFYEIFKFLILMERRPFEGVVGYEDGMENYFKRLVMISSDYGDFITRATTKRYPTSRIKRMMINYILENKAAFNMYNIGFYRVLGFNEKSEFVFKDSKLKPVLTKKDGDELSFTDQMLYSQMVDASNLYSLALNREVYLDYTKKIGRY